MSIGKNCIVVGNFPDDVPDNHVCIDLKAFNRLTESPAILGPTSESGVYVCLFKALPLPADASDMRVDTGETSISTGKNCIAPSIRSLHLQLVKMIERIKGGGVP